MTKTKNAVMCAFFTAIICITAPFGIVIGMVPVTFTLFSLALTAFVAGSKNAFKATAVYILIGVAGMPVFSGFKSGLSAFVGPTGGFIFSYIFIALILGKCAKTKSKAKLALLCAAALLVCYVCGTVGYMIFADCSVYTALTLCVIPFIPFDIVKLVIAYIVAESIKKAKKVVN